MSEEVRQARHAVPRAMFWTIVLNGIFAYAIILAMLFCLGDMDAALSADFPIIEILTQATAPIASASRLTWAWARDGGLPAWFAHISAQHRIPVRSIWLPILVVMCLACLNIASSAAFGAFIALASLALFTSYAIAIGCMLRARLRNEVQYGGWTLGRYGVPINIFALIYTGWMMVVFCFPQYLPVSGTNFNYALPIFAFVVLLALVHWFVRARKHWPGLNEEVIDAVLADSDRSATD
ncbi:hypothetical protein LTR08_007226 [Meristemomyces frigidus]|nr:hypothetical protein LTR08_007226 [Meristemomyces frigidus]